MRRLAALALFALPVLYAGSIAAVFLHEAVGHGLTAAALGGIFEGFTVRLDGMGWADIKVPSFSVAELTLMYLGGAAVTSLACLLFYALGRFGRFKPLTRLGFALLGFVFMLDGFPYYFWDAILLGGIGDFSLVWNLHPSQALRAAFIVLSGSGMVAAIVILNSVWFRVASGLCSRIASHALALALQAVCWFAFDWNQIVPGAGLAPSLVGMAIAALTLAAMDRVRKALPETSDIDSRNLRLPLFFAWGACMVAVFVVLFFLRDGIRLS